MVTMKCICLTAKGIRCKNNASSGSKYCRVHQKCKNLSTSSISRRPSPRRAEKISTVCNRAVDVLGEDKVRATLDREIREHQRRQTPSPQTKRRQEEAARIREEARGAKRADQYEASKGVPYDQCSHIEGKPKCPHFCKDTGKKGKQKYAYECYKYR